MKTLTIALATLFTVHAAASEFFFEKDRSLPLVHISVVFKGGSTQDPDGKNGATDLMSRLILRGTKSKTKQQIDLTLDQLGAELGSETRGEYLVIRGSVLSENLTPFLNLMEEVMTSPSFRSSEFEKLKKEQISNLMEVLDNDQRLIRTKFDQIFFKGHPYSKLNQGRIKDVQSLSIQDIQKQHDKIFNESRMLVLAAGDSSASSFDTFRQHLDSKLKRSIPLDQIQPFSGFPRKNKLVLIDKPDRTQTQIAIAQRGTTFQDPTLDALQIANFAFGGGTFLSKLMIELRVKRGWTYGAGSAFKFASQPHSWRVSFFPKNADTPAAIKEAIQMIINLRDQGITEAEFTAARNSMLNNEGFNHNTPAKRMENLMIEKLFNLPEGYHKDAAKRLAALKLEDVNAALKKFIDPQHLLIGVVATSSISKSAIAKELGIPEKEVEVIDYRF
jgi:zinc protease